MPQTGQSLTDLVDTICASTAGEKISIGHLLDAFDSRSYGAFLLVPAVIAVAPTGAIPGMSIVTGTIIIFICLQMMVGRNHIWLPDRAENFEMPREKVQSAASAIRPYAAWIDGWLTSRWTPLTGPIGRIGIAVMCTLLALSMFPLALLPFAVAIPGTAIALFAIGLTTRDGVVIAIGYVLALAAGALLYVYF